MSTASNSDSLNQPLLSEAHGSPRRSDPGRPALHPPPHPRSRLALPKSMHDRAVPAATNPLANDHFEVAHLHDQGKLWTPDRGAGFYQTERERYHKPALVSTGR